MKKKNFQLILNKKKHSSIKLIHYIKEIYINILYQERSEWILSVWNEKETHNHINGREFDFINILQYDSLDANSNLRNYILL